MVYQSKYAWNGMKYSVPADTVGAILEDIEQQNGTVSKELFLDASRDKDSPTHGMFEWDDSIAGEKWRLDQARKIICSLSLNIQYGESVQENINLSVDRNMTVPAFVSIVPRGGSITESSKYVNVHNGLSDPETRTVVINNAMRLLKMFKNKYSAYEEFARIISEIDYLDRLLQSEEDKNGQ